MWYIYLTKQRVAWGADTLTKLLKWSSKDEEQNSESCGYQDNKNTEGHSPTDNRKGWSLKEGVEHKRRGGA